MHPKEMDVSRLERAAFASYAKRLARIGVERQKGDVFTYGASGDVLGWFGFPTSHNTHPGCVAVNMIVGLHHIKLQHIYGELRRFEQRYMLATAARSLADIEPELDPYSWIFDATSSIDLAADRLVRDVEEYAIPFVNSHASLEGVIELLNYSRRTLDESERLAIAFALAGDSSSARSELATLIEEDPDYEMEFARRFGEYFNIDSTNF